MGTIASTGSTIVTANYGRFRRRVTFGVIALVLLLVGGVVGVGVLLDDGAVADPTEVVAIPEAELPELGETVPVLAALGTDAPAPDPAVLNAQLQPLVASSALGTGVSASVVDVADGTVLLDLDAADPATPASTTKLLTVAAALTVLDPSDRIATTVVAGTAPGEVVLVGGGDPTLSRTTPSQIYPGAATVDDLAAQVTAAIPAGTPVSRIVVDSSLFSGPLTADGWGAGDAPSSYAAPVTAAAVDGARVNPGGAARSGQPGLDAGAALGDALGVPAAPVVLGSAPAGARVLATVRSAPIARLVEQTLSMSDNVLAEALARQVALARGLPATFDGSARAVTGALAEAGLDMTGVALFDGSGLSRNDRAPAGLLTDVLRGAADGSLVGTSRLLSGLPVAGYDGTLFDRGDEDTAPGAVRAKTGTLLGVHALAGTVVTADGRLLAFAVMADESTGNELATEAALDDIAAALALCGCR